MSWMTPRAETPAPRLLSWSALLRRGWIVPLVMGCAALAAMLLAQQRETSYSAESTVIVSTSPGRLGPGAANDATTLARTYAGVIPEDRRVLATLARVVRRPVDEVETGVSVINDPGTFLLRLGYRDPEEARAIAGADALARAVLRPPRRGSAIGQGSLRLVSRADDARRVAGDVRLAVIIGSLLGGFVGLVLLLGWERADRRIDDERDLKAEFRGGVSALYRMNEQGLVALRERWLGLAGVPDPRVGLIAVNKRSLPAAQRTAERLAEVGGEQLTFHVGGPLGGAAELAALEADLTVLVVAKGSPAQDVSRALSTLEQFDRPARWALLVRRRGRSAGSLEPPREEGEQAPPDPATAPGAMAAPETEAAPLVDRR